MANKLVNKEELLYITKQDRTAPLSISNSTIDYNYGGYKQSLLTQELSLVEQKQYLCYSCQGILRNPCTIVGIGEAPINVCNSCISRKTLPQIKKHMGRHITIMQCIKVNCAFRSKSCNWQGTVSELEVHIDSICPFVKVKCSFAKQGCDAEIERHEVSKHMESSNTRHMELLCAFLEMKEEKEKILEKHIIQLYAKIKYLTKGGIIWRIPYIQLQSEIFLLSPEFYVGLYKFQCLMRKNSNESVGIFVQIMKGEFDETLEWPLNGNCVITLNNCINEKYNLSCLVKFDAKVGQITKPEEAIGKAIGLDDFIKFKDLIDNSKYIDNGNNIIIKVFVECNNIVY